jgi:hypothetical protein
VTSLGMSSSVSEMPCPQYLRSVLIQDLIVGLSEELIVVD